MERTVTIGFVGCSVVDNAYPPLPSETWSQISSVSGGTGGYAGSGGSGGSAGGGGGSTTKAPTCAERRRGRFSERSRRAKLLSSRGRIQWRFARPVHGRSQSRQSCAIELPSRVLSNFGRRSRRRVRTELRTERDAGFLNSSPMRVHRLRDLVQLLRHDVHRFRRWYGRVSYRYSATSIP